MSRSRFKSKPWVTSGIMKSINHKNCLYRKYLSSPSADRKIKLSNYRKLLTKLIHEAESLYYKDILSSRDTSAKKAWSVINNIINNKNNKRSPMISEIIHNGTNYTDKTDIANAFNEYFSNIGMNLANELPSNNNLTVSQFMDKLTPQSIFLSPVDEPEIKEEINKLKLGKSPGFDGLNPKLLKSISHVITPVLAHIFNMSFSNGSYPSAFKKAKVIPLFKKGDRKLPENYRPISLLSCINKLLEKILEKRLRNFLCQNNVFYEYQFGFRTGHSTTQALLEITNSIRAFLDEGENVLGLYLDLKKAFDTVNHAILKQKMYNYGLRGKCYDLLSSYLSDRTQLMFVNGVYSTSMQVNTGVPQGSVLGPLLFLIYVNDIKNVVPDVSIRLFADDTNVFVHSRECARLIDDAKCTILQLKTWFDTNKLTLHLGKTNYTIFHSKKRTTLVLINSILAMTLFARPIKLNILDLSLMINFHGSRMLSNYAIT
jgi:hypothetical protein